MEAYASMHGRVSQASEPGESGCVVCAALKWGGRVVIGLSLHQPSKAGPPTHQANQAHTRERNTSYIE